MIEITPKTSRGLELDLLLACLGDGSQDPFPESKFHLYHYFPYCKSSKVQRQKEMTKPESGEGILAVGSSNVCFHRPNPRLSQRVHGTFNSSQLKLLVVSPVKHQLQILYNLLRESL